MADILGARLEKLIEDRRTSQSSVARAIGVSQPTIGRLISGETRETGKIIELARELKTSPEYLIGETDDDSPAARIVIAAPQEFQDDADMVEIDSIDMKYGMGGSFLDTDHIEVEKVKFSRSWIRQFTSSPPNMLCTTKGMGDSMMPTIHDQDVVIIDRSQTRPEMGDMIWAVVYSGWGMIKRLRALPDGRIRISSDNQLVRDEYSTDGDLFIVGRVIAAVKSL
ncbi:XRE family transcriptional regulator [Sphingomonas bisphenolicum]